MHISEIFLPHIINHLITRKQLFVPFAAAEVITIIFHNLVHARLAFFVGFPTKSHAMLPPRVIFLEQITE